ncbi:MAG: hotdog family protein [Planctomycetota bacterium]|jgi:3-hydroxyacyl-[acyl-carrier-protein] dehydratase
MRYVLIDRFLELERGERARAVKCVTRGEPVVGDAYPSALVLEALLQTGGVLARSGAGSESMSVLGKVDRAVFPAEAHPGDRIQLDVRATRSRPEGTVCEGVATVDGKVVGEASFLIVFLPAELAPPPDPEIAEYRRNLMQALAIPLEES